MELGRGEECLTVCWYCSLLKISLIRLIDNRLKTHTDQIKIVHKLVYTLEDCTSSSGCLGEGKGEGRWKGGRDGIKVGW